jgi:hypothetical protein
MPDGAWVIVYDGNVEYRPTQQEAEDFFNQLEAQSGAGGMPGTPPTGGSGDAFNWGGLWGSMTGSNQQRFDEMVRQFNEQQRLQQQGQYGNMAMGLLSGAAGLRGPADWLNYAQYTNGGRNIFQSLYGNTPAPGFASPTGNSAPMTIQDILNSLGLGSGQAASTAAATGSTGGETPPATGAGTGGTPTTNANMAPLPYQINPMVWDSMSNTAKQMIIASVEKGNTPSGAWSAEDYLDQFNASRPKGNAPRQVAYSWGNQKSLY